MKEASIAKSSYYALASQAISIGVSFLTTILLPKALSINDFGFYQLFILYASYVGLAHLGFNDGVFLFLGGKRFDEVDKSEWGGKYMLGITFFALLSVVVAMSCFFALQQEYKWVGIFVAVFIFVDNIYTLLNFHMIATAHMVVYSKVVIMSKLVFLCSVMLLFVLPQLRNFYYVTSAYIVAQSIALIYILRYFRGYFCIKHFANANKRKLLIGVSACIIAGFPLTVSNLLSSFILGSGRIIIERIWSIETFSKISLAMTLNAFLLTFISQISYVLFPFLRRTSAQQQKELLNNFVRLIGSTVLVCTILYLPLYVLIVAYLPQYADSATYLFSLIPIAYFDTKTCLVFNTYFKSLMKQKMLFCINLLTFGFALILYTLNGWLRNLDGMVLSMVLALTFRCTIMQVFLFRYFKVEQNVSSLVIETALTFLLGLGFIFGGKIGFVAIYLLAIVPYIYVNKQKILDSIATIKATI